jgi:hypothetical protein
VHRLTTGFVLGYHGCDRTVGERMLSGDPFKPSNNDYDWLGPGIYFWEANPVRGLEFAREPRHKSVKEAFVVGAVIELGWCLDLTTTAGIELVTAAHQSLVAISQAAGVELPTNSGDSLRRNLDCAVMRRVHSILEEAGIAPVDTVRGVFIEGKPIYDTAGFHTKTHIQIAVCNPACIKRVFGVPSFAIYRRHRRHRATSLARPGTAYRSAKRGSWRHGRWSRMVLA